MIIKVVEARGWKSSVIRMPVRDVPSGCRRLRRISFETQWDVHVPNKTGSMIDELHVVSLEDSETPYSKVVDKTILGNAILGPQ